MLKEWRYRAVLGPVILARLAACSVLGVRGVSGRGVAWAARYCARRRRL